MVEKIRPIFIFMNKIILTCFQDIGSLLFFNHWF